MKITILERYTWNDLEVQLRTVPLKGDATILPYQHARISLKRFFPEEVNPPQFYLLRGNMHTQIMLNRVLREDHGIDTLHLNGAVKFEIQDTNMKAEDCIKTLTPPIIELTPRTVHYVPQSGEITYEQPTKIMIALINDGMHRVGIARLLQSDFTGVFVSGAPEAYAYYAHPNNWDQVFMVDEVPKDKTQKKMYTRENVYFLYRDFSVLGCGKPREAGATS